MAGRVISFALRVGAPTLWSLADLRALGSVYAMRAKTEGPKKGQAAPEQEKMAASKKKIIKKGKTLDWRAPKDIRKRKPREKNGRKSMVKSSMQVTASASQPGLPPLDLGSRNALQSEAKSGSPLNSNLVPLQAQRNASDGRLAEMPQLCFGTAQGDSGDVKRNIASAIRFGYRHLDTAEVYKHFVPQGDAKLSYADAIREGIQEGLGSQSKSDLSGPLTREDLWITYKSDDLRASTVMKFVQDTDVGYLDLVLVHHGCGEEKKGRRFYVPGGRPGEYNYRNSEQEFGRALEDIKTLFADHPGLIRNWGVSNCESVPILHRLKSAVPNHPLYANQIQALPPGASFEAVWEFSRKSGTDSDLVEESNKLDISTMLYAPISGLGWEGQLAGFDKNHPLHGSGPIRYYLQKYIRDRKNVLMVGSISGGSLQSNYDEYKRIVKESREQVPDAEVIQKELQKVQYVMMG
jgi:diketogulonate reductase-like aldo/keto reductase